MRRSSAAPFGPGFGGGMTASTPTAITCTSRSCLTHLYDDIRPSIADVTPTLTERIIATVEETDVPNLIWTDRGLAPSGYTKGMAVAFARVYAKWKTGNSAELVMAAANSRDDTRDALSLYNSRFQPKAMDNSKAGADTLRHLFVLP